MLAKNQRYQNVEVFVDDVLITKTSASLRVPDDYIIRIALSKTGKTLKLKWPKVSVSVATLEVVYNEGKRLFSMVFFEWNFMRLI